MQGHIIHAKLRVKKDAPVNHWLFDEYNSFTSVPEGRMTRVSRLSGLRFAVLSS